jgi:hypothetical protein
LRPGVYSLIDICEESDFQQLHTYLGGVWFLPVLFMNNCYFHKSFLTPKIILSFFGFVEGPCRTTLANLVNDYKLHFQYQGKI